MSDKLSGIDNQKEGGSHDAESKKYYDSVDEAKINFQLLKDRLLNINDWQSYSGEMTASFQLFDEKGEELKTKAKLGDFIRIDIPGPGSFEGDGYDWVKVTQIDENPYEDDERYLMVCVPSVNPTTENAQDIAHFYTNKASSNFIVRRKGKCIYVEIHGRNEVTNLKTENIPDKIRNAVVSIMSRLGISKIQWKSLAEGLLDYK